MAGREENQKTLNETLGNILKNAEDRSIPFADAEIEQQETEWRPQKETIATRKNSQNLKLNIPVPKPPKEVTIVEIASPSIHSIENYETQDHPGPLKNSTTTGTARRGMRRNSISLPTGLDSMDMAILQNLHQMGGDTSDSDSDSDRDNESMVCSLAGRDINSPVILSDDEDQKPVTAKNSKVGWQCDDDDLSSRPQLKSLRSKRKLSVAPLPSFRLNDKEMIANEFDSHSVASNQNSITSVSSLASLLKEKMQMFPAMIKKKKQSSDDFNIKAFVITLFLVIVFLVGYAYIAYHQKVLAHSYFDRVKMNKETRTFQISDNSGQMLLEGRMATHMVSGLPYHCLREHLKNDGSICLEWNDKARLYLHYEDPLPSTRCYTVHWLALVDNLYPTDCFDMSEEKGYWYGGGVTNTSDWPLHKASFGFVPFVTGDARVQKFGNVLKRYFINSRGLALSIDERVPLYLSMNHEGSNEMCFRAQNDQYAYVNRLTPLPELKYKICIGEDMLSLHHNMTQKSLWDGIKEKDVKIVHSLLEEPVWQIPAREDLTEAAIFNYTEKIIALSSLKLGHVLINEFWQEQIGDFTLDVSRFETLVSTINLLHRRGFRISLTVQPFISTDSHNFGEAVAKKLLIYERRSERSIPALTRYKSTPSAGVLDVTNNASIPWLLQKLDKVAELYEIDSFYLDLGTAYNIPHYYQCTKTIDNPDQYKSIFIGQVEESLKMIGVSGGVSVPRPPTFINLPAVNSSWSGLQSIIPTVLSYGVIGYPFLLPGPVGGDFIIKPNHTKMASFYALDTPPLPDQELYIRWFQLSTFLPVLRFTHLPSEYETELVNDVLKELTMIRQKTVAPILKKYLTEAMNDALPLVRPLWTLDPTDAACLTINDEFSVADIIIVAPILHPGVVFREVYLPQGVWKDGIDGSLRKGSRWIHNYKVPLHKVAYFIKMPADTRF